MVTNKVATPHVLTQHVVGVFRPNSRSSGGSETIVTCIYAGAMQELMPIMHTELGPPAVVVAKSAQVRTGDLLTSPFFTRTVSCWFVITLNDHNLI